MEFIFINDIDENENNSQLDLIENIHFINFTLDLLIYKDWCCQILQIVTERAIGHFLNVSKIITRTNIL